MAMLGVSTTGASTDRQADRPRSRIPLWKRGDFGSRAAQCGSAVHYDKVKVMTMPFGRSNETSYGFMASYLYEMDQLERRRMQYRAFKP